VSHNAFDFGSRDVTLSRQKINRGRTRNPSRDRRWFPYRDGSQPHRSRELQVSFSKYSSRIRSLTIPDTLQRGPRSLPPIQCSRWHPRPPQCAICPPLHTISRWSRHQTTSTNNATTSCQTFAQTKTLDEVGEVRKEKGISHRKKEKAVWDEEKQEWVNRWGWKGKNKELEGNGSRRSLLTLVRLLILIDLKT
jgi:hypothetical protein